MNRRLLFFLVALPVLSVQKACTTESMKPTYVAEVSVDPARYGEFVGKVDMAMKAAGLLRFGGTPGLNDLRGREVMFFIYKSRRDDKWAFVEISDVIASGTIHVRVYPEVLEDESSRNVAISQLKGVLAQFGSSLNAEAPKPTSLGRG